MKRRLWLTGAALLGVAALAGDRPASAPAPADGGVLLADEIPEIARRLLRNRMQRHGRQAVDLVNAAVLLDYATAEAIAADIADEPRIVPPVPGSDEELNRALPQRFFLLQDALRSHARECAQASRARDPARLGRSLAGMLQTCTECHAAFYGH